MDQDLQRYINDHLAGSEGALILIQDLADRQEDDAEKRFFLELKAKVAGDQTILKDLLKEAGLEKSLLLQIAGSVTARAGRIKLMWEGMEAGKLGMFEALEMLTLGIQGKRLLWVVLGEIAPSFPEWSHHRFADLELEAIQQRDAVEERRVAAGREALAGADRRNR